MSRIDLLKAVYEKLHFTLWGTMMSQDNGECSPAAARLIKTLVEAKAADRLCRVLLGSGTKQEAEKFLFPPGGIN